MVWEGSPREGRPYPDRLCNDDSPINTGNGILLVMKARFTYWKEPDGRYLGFLNDYPDHWTQGDDLSDLKEHLRDLLELFGAEEIPGIRKVEELEYA